MSLRAPVIVFGEGSASVFLISQLIKKTEKVLWFAGSGSKLTPVMPFVTHGSALGVMIDSLSVVSDQAFARPIEQGIFHRVFRNKGFKLPTWKRSPNLNLQQQAFEELVWAPEQAFLSPQEIRMAGLTPARAESILRTALSEHPSVQKVDSAPVQKFEISPDGGNIELANGFQASFKEFYFCDSLSDLKAIPALAPLFKHQMSAVKGGDQVNALQVTFHHRVDFTQSRDLGLVIPMNREAGEKFDRDVLGYFLEDNQSVWTIFLQPEECEDNHDIMKKLRKLKQSLNRAFDQPEFLPAGAKDFLSTIEKEFFRFEANCLVTAGQLKPAKDITPFHLVTDAFGFSKALQSIAVLFQIEAVEFFAEASAEDSAATDEEEGSLVQGSEHSA